MPHRSPFLLALLLALAACAGPRPDAPLGPDLSPASITHTVVAEDLGADPEMEALVAPYREQLEREMREVIAEAAFEITKDRRWESPLGNLAADAMLVVAEEELGRSLDLAVGNAGGLRVPLSAGPVTRGNVFELMPFDNYIVVQTMTGVQVDTLAQQIARFGGEPVAGIAFRVSPERRALDIQVRGEPLDRTATYEVVTHNYLAYGGGDMPILWEPVDRRELPLPLRDAFIRYFRDLGTLAPEVEGRIRPTE